MRVLQQRHVLAELSRALVLVANVDLRVCGIYLHTVSTTVCIVLLLQAVVGHLPAHSHMQTCNSHLLLHCRQRQGH